MPGQSGSVSVGSPFAQPPWRRFYAAAGEAVTASRADGVDPDQCRQLRVCGLGRFAQVVVLLKDDPSPRLLGPLVVATEVDTVAQAEGDAEHLADVGGHVLEIRRTAERRLTRGSPTRRPP